MSQPVELLVRIQQRLAHIETAEPANSLALVVDKLLRVVGIHLVIGRKTSFSSSDRSLAVPRETPSEVAADHDVHEQFHPGRATRCFISLHRD